MSTTVPLTSTAKKVNFSSKDFLNKGDQIHRKLRIWSHLLKKSLMQNFIFLYSADSTNEMSNISDDVPVQ